MSYLIRRKDNEPFAMAGLWERWQGEADQALESCSIIVTDANDLVRDVHDRMSVILAPADFAAWLDPGAKDAGGLLRMLKPTDPGPWSMHPVSRQVNSPRNDGPDLLQPIAAERA
jgi:putative SOS response-associated peptidase YedK